jgi:hypothetical protein
MRYLGEKKRKRKKGVEKTGTMVGFDQEWEARQDAEALARADAVKCDPERMTRAKAWAAKQLEESKAKVSEAQKMIELGSS